MTPIDLSTFPVAELLWSSSAGVRTGELVVADGEIERRVIFADGRLVGAGSSAPEEGLARYLPQSERSPGQTSEGGAGTARRGAEARVADDGAACGAVSRRQLGQAMARRVKAIVLSLFPASSGTAFFAERGRRMAEEEMVGVSLHRLLYVGIRSMRSPELVRVGLGDLSREVRMAAKPPFQFILRKCPPGELETLERVRAPTTLRQLVTLEDGSLSPARAKAVYALYASGVIEDVTDAEHAPLQPVPHVETNGFLSEESGGGQPDDETIREEVERELLFTARLDLPAWVRISSRREVVQALRRKLRRSLGFLELVASGSALEARIETLIGRLTTRLVRLETVRLMADDDDDTGERAAAQVRAVLEGRSVVRVCPPASREADLDATQTIPPAVRSRVGRADGRARGGAEAGADDAEVTRRPGPRGAGRFA